MIDWSVLTRTARQVLLAFDTIYAEGQRRYVRVAFKLCPYVPRADGSRMSITLTAFRRPFPSTENNLQKPAFHGRHGDGNLRLSAPLYARASVCHCRSAAEIRQQTVDQIVDRVMEMRSARKNSGFGAVVRGRKGESTKKEFEAARKGGFVRVRADGIIL